MRTPEPRLSERRSRDPKTSAVNVDDVRYVSGSEELKAAGTAIRSAHFDGFIPTEGQARVLRRGIVSCSEFVGCAITLLNPKAILFFISFFIQFVEPGYAHRALSFLVLGAVVQVFSALYLTTLIFSGQFLAGQFRRRKPPRLGWFSPPSASDRALTRSYPPDRRRCGRGCAACRPATR